MNKFFLSALVGILMFFAVAANVSAHCEIPCGIYDDAMRIKMVAEHITTVEKSMKQVIALEKNKQANMNQLVRWVTNKEKHADEIQHIVAQYFMTQRIKLGYVEKAGAWYSIEGERIGQGKDNARDYLKEHQELRQSVEAKIREKLMNDGSDTE